MVKRDLIANIQARVVAGQQCKTWKQYHYHKEELQNLAPSVTDVNDDAVSALFAAAQKECMDVWWRGIHELEHKD